MLKLTYIGLFGLLGVFARYGFGMLTGKIVGQPFVLGTFFINVIGSFLIGCMYVLAVENTLIPTDLRVGIMVGFLGGFTTFSSYCLESFQLINESQYVLAAAYFLLSPCLGFLATLTGVGIVRYVLRHS